MKKYHCKSLEALTPIPVSALLTRLAAAQFTDLDLWSVPRGHNINITDVPLAGNITLRRTSSALRFNWAAASLPIPPTQVDMRRIVEAALYAGATVRRQSGVKVAGYRSTRFVVIWLPLCRSGREALERLNVEIAALWHAARQLCVAAETVVAEPGGVAVGE